MIKKNILTGLVVFLILVATNIASMYLSFNSGQKKGWMNAKERLRELTDYEILGDESQPKYKAVGEITEIRNNEITVKISPFDLLGDPDLDFRVASIDQKTKIIKRIMKDENSYEEEVFKYLSSSKYKSGSEEYYKYYPVIFNEKAMDAKDLKKGQRVELVSDVNIRSLKSFTVKRIVVKE